MRFRRILVWPVVLVAAGCTRDPLERTVDVPTSSRMAAWRAHIGSDSGADTRRRVEEALNEIRLNATGERELKRAMGERVASGTDAIDEAVRQRVDGRPLREVVQLGYELRVRRLKEEMVGLEDAMSKNALLVTRPGDVDSKQHLEGLRDRQAARLAKYREELAAAEKELEPLLAKTGRRLIDVSNDKVAPAPPPTTRPSSV